MSNLITLTRLGLAPAVWFCATNLVIADDYEFPADEWKTSAPSEAGWNSAKLEAAIDFAMSRGSSSVVIAHRGRILAERHSQLDQPSLRYTAMKRGETSDGLAIEDVASVQKSIVSLLVGVAVDRRLMALDDSVQKHLGVGWSNANQAQEAAITVRHLVTMTSGLNTKLDFVAAPGTRWQYNTNAYAKSLSCVEAASKKTANELTSQWLLQRIGMRDSKWAERVWLPDRGVDANRRGFATSARDLARFGVLVLAGGKWESQTVVSEQYLREALTPSQSLNLSYGYLWWLNGQSSAIRGGRRTRGPLNASAPNDLVAALGALGRKCYIVPSMDLVVVRLGDDVERPNQKKFDVEFWRLLMLAKPNGSAVESAE